jgi:cobalt-precorrin-5B (C1)-methyltransferase
MPGLRVAVGEPAINPVPRAMMRAAVAEVLAEVQAEASAGGFDLTIGCREGLAIAPKTFNPKLGIVGGISILGTSGIVEPMSMASWIASIEVYIRVALAACAPGDAVAYLPGKIGRVFVAQTLGLPDKRSVQIANFLGDALDFTQQALAKKDARCRCCGWPAIRASWPRCWMGCGTPTPARATWPCRAWPAWRKK